MKGRHSTKKAALGMSITLLGGLTVSGVSVYFVWGPPEPGIFGARTGAPRLQWQSGALRAEVVGSDNTLYIREARGPMPDENLQFVGSEQSHTLYLSPSQHLIVEVKGSNNTIHVSPALRERVFLNSIGSRNHIQGSAPPAASARR